MKSEVEKVKESRSGTVFPVNPQSVKSSETSANSVKWIGTANEELSRQTSNKVFTGVSRSVQTKASLVSDVFYVSGTAYLEFTFDYDSSYELIPAAGSNPTRILRPGQVCLNMVLIEKQGSPSYTQPVYNTAFTQKNGVPIRVKLDKGNYRFHAYANNRISYKDTDTDLPEAMIAKAYCRAYATDAAGNVYQAKLSPEQTIGPATSGM